MLRHTKRYTKLLLTTRSQIFLLFDLSILLVLNNRSITVLSLVAQSKSEQKSKSIKWAYKRRWAKGVGIQPNWALLGYELGDDQAWVINEYEAEVVRAIYSLYLDGYSSPQVAEVLTRNEIPTVKGLATWSTGSVLGILRNEKHCGDVLCQKTVTVDFFTHKSVKNSGHEPQYFIEGHHEPIIAKDDWLRVQQILKEKTVTRWTPRANCSSR